MPKCRTTPFFTLLLKKHAINLAYFINCAMPKKQLYGMNFGWVPYGNEKKISKLWYYLHSLSSKMKSINCSNLWISSYLTQ